MKIIDTTEFTNEGKWINLSIRICLDKNEENVSKILSIFKAFQKSDDYRDPQLTIKEKDNNIVIDYGMRMNKFEEEHSIILTDFKKRISNIDRNYQIEKTNVSFNTNYRDMKRVRTVLMDNTNININTDKESVQEWFEKNISKNTLILDLLINGQHSYRVGRLDKETVSITKYTPFQSNNFNETSILKDDETANISKSELQKVYKNILTKLNISSYPLSLFNKDFIFMLIENEFELFNTIYADRNSVGEARDFYLIAKKRNNEKGIIFFRKILEKDTTLSNPILRENEPIVHIYKVYGRAIKGDTYETWIGDVNHTFMSKTILDTDKVTSLYKEVFDYEVNEFLEINSMYDGEREGSDNYSLIKVRDNGEYINISSENRFEKEN